MPGYDDRVTAENQQPDETSGPWQPGAWQSQDLASEAEDIERTQQLLMASELRLDESDLALRMLLGMVR